jgi:hypothetical protein
MTTDPQTDADRFCAGTQPAQNGLEERLDMIVAQLAVIAYELHELNERRDDGPSA